jgi:hypothetical protein
MLNSYYVRTARTLFEEQPEVRVGLRVVAQAEVADGQVITR